MAVIYDIPSGPKNLDSIFPDIDFSLMSEYFLEVLDDSDNILATTPLMKTGCCCNSEGVRLTFFNYLGRFDGINFSKPIISHDTIFNTYKKSLNYPLAKTDTGTERFDLSSNDTYQVKTTCYNEEDMKWAQELIDSPKAFLQWIGIQGQADSYIPIIITSTKFEKQKIQNEWQYPIILEFKLANEYFIIRN